MCELAVVRLPCDCMNKLICVECKGYLRIGPVKIKLDGESVCGKCSSNTKFSSAIYAKSLNDILSEVSFPCRYEDYGCTEYLPFDDTSNHEASCNFKSYCCPADFLMCSWIGTASQISEHYRECHQAEILSESVFQVHTNESSEENRLYILEQFAFLVKAKTSLDENKLWINLEYIGDKDIAAQISYKLIFHGEDVNGLQMITKERNPIPISTQTVFDVNSSEWVDIKPLMNLLKEPVKLYCSLSIYVPRRIVAEIKDKLRKIKCLSCYSYMSIPIYQCPVGHNVCTDCTAYNNTCALCKKTNVIFDRNSELEILSTSHLLKCRWPNCNQAFSESSIRKHEQMCTHKNYRCPRCNKWCGKQEEVKKHFLKDHGTYPLHRSDVTVIPGNTYTHDFYMLTYGEIFACSLLRTNENERHFTAWYYGPATFYNSYRFLIETKSNNSEMNNKSYELLKCSPIGNSYSFKVTISNEDIVTSEDDFEFVFKIIRSSSNA